MNAVLYCLMASSFNMWTSSARYKPEAPWQQSHYPDECGYTMYGAGNPVGKRIVGGSQSKPGQWPWQVYITYKNNFTCSGSIVSGSWIVTAAHCIQHRDTPEDYMVKVGEYRVNQHDGSEQYFSVKRFAVNPDFDRTTGKNDIAMIKINGLIGFNNQVRKICLPLTTSPLSNCVVSGWGVTRDFSDPGYLKHTPVSIIPLPVCKSNYLAAGLDNVFNNNICAGTSQGENIACKGDSGGPLACQSQGVWRLEGVVSWAKECDKKNVPGVYTKVSSFIQWIKVTLREG